MDAAAAAAAEKMSALKKAYADIILNTARESAARIIESERKAMRWQRSLVDAKEQALSTVLRVKSVMDAKVNFLEVTGIDPPPKPLVPQVLTTRPRTIGCIAVMSSNGVTCNVSNLINRLEMILEAGKTSLDQERRIQELEAQLSKAHDTISHLKEELTRANNKSIIRSECPKELEPADMRSMVHVNLVKKDAESLQLDDSKLTTSHMNSEEIVDICDMRNDVPSKHSDAKDETTYGSNGTLAQAGKNKFLKYTFQRTRKRGSCSGKKESSVAEREVTKKRKLGDEHNVIVEPRNPSLVTELPRDNRRLVQVARQLISLSEKRW